MPNPRFLQTAERWKNQAPPEERNRVEKTKRAVDTQDLDYFFLGGKLGKETHDLIVKKYGADSPFVTQNVVYDKNVGLIKGSKLGYIIALNEFLPDGMRTSTSYDLQKAIDGKKVFQKGTYEDLGLVLYNESGMNEYLARDLAGQIKDRQELRFPALINLTGLKLRFENKAPNGIAFNLGDESQIIYAPILSCSNDRKKFSKLDGDGLPIFEDNGDHTFYAGSSGLSVLFRDRYSDLYARDRYLVYSNADGRVLVCREAARSKSGGK